MIRVGSLCAAGQELSRSHYEQVELPESVSIAGDDEVGSRLLGGEVLHRIFEIGRMGGKGIDD